jgi:cell division protein FtsI (penicillin-binding protein 3)
VIRVSRVGAVHGAFVLFAVALLGRAAWVQVGQADRWRARATGQQEVQTEIPAVRGAILDAAGTVLVESRPLVRLDIAPTEVKKPGELAAALRRAGVAPEFVRRATDRRRKWVELPGRFLSTDIEEILAMRGVHPRPVLERVPPSTDGLRRLLGTVDREGRAIGGMEAALDGALRGTPGRTVLVKAGRAGRLSSPEERYEAPAPGRTAVLTLHQGLQDIAERALSDAIGSMQAQGGDIVVLDPHTGEIRALASRRARADASGATALTEPYEPGSTLKPFIAAALLERGRVALDDVVNTHDGVWRINGRTINDVHRAARMDFAEVIRQSSNIGMVQFAERLTPAEQYETLRDAGFGMVTGVPYPSESSGRLRMPREWSGFSQASLAMGYEIAVTPLQLALAYGAIANGGELLEPALVKELRRDDGKVVYESRRRVVRRIMSEETARTLRGLLREVVTGGTSKGANLATYELAGKSGTARRVSADGTGYEAGSYTASFVGLFPADKPQLVILVKLDDPQGAYYGGRIAAPVTKAVLEMAIAARDGALDARTLTGPRLQQLASAKQAAAETTMTEAVREAEEKAAQQAQPSAPFVVELGVPAPAPKRVVTARPVPDVRGLPTRQAVHELHRAGFRVSLVRGGDPSDRSHTSPAAGTVLAAGTTVRLASQR